MIETILIKLINQNIDFERANKRLQVEREKGYQFIRAALNV